MNKIIRVIISVPLSVVVTTLIAAVLTVVTAFLLQFGAVHWKSVSTAFTEAYVIAIFVTTLPALVSATVIPLLNLRPLRAAAAGAAAQALWLLMILAFFGALTNPGAGKFFIPVVTWAMCYVAGGAGSGFLCGFLSPRKVSAQGNVHLP